MDKYIKIFLCLTIGSLMLAGSVKAEPTEEAGLSRDEAIKIISNSDVVKQKLGDLFSFTTGYDLSKINRAKLTPIISYIRVVPKRVPPDGRTILELQAQVEDPSGPKNIAGVKADLSSIGRLASTVLVDNGMFGDKSAGGKIYSTQTSVSPKINLGKKEITVSAANKRGWLALAKTQLDVDKTPLILEATANPARLAVKSKTKVELVVRVDNPGRNQDMAFIYLDMSSLGISSKLALKYVPGSGEVESDLWMGEFVLPENVGPGEYWLPLEIVNQSGGSAFGKIELAVY